VIGYPPLLLSDKRKLIAPFVNSSDLDAGVRACLSSGIGKSSNVIDYKAGAGLLAGLVTPGRPTLEQPVPESLHPVGGPHAGAVHGELQPLGRTHVGEVCGELSPVRVTFTLEQGQSMRSPCPEGQRASEPTCDELTLTPILCPLVLLRGRRKRNGSEAEPGKKGGVGGRCFKIWIYFSLSYSNLISD